MCTSCSRYIYQAIILEGCLAPTLCVKIMSGIKRLKMRRTVRHQSLISMFAKWSPEKQTKNREKAETSEADVCNKTGLAV